MLDKKIIFLVILLISLLSISAASAADDVTSDITSISDDAILEESINEEISVEEVSNEEPILAAEEEEILDSPAEKPILSASTGTFTDLNKTINDNTNSVINLNQNYAYDSKSDSAFVDGVIINRTVTLTVMELHLMETIWHVYSW